MTWELGREASSAIVTPDIGNPIFISDYLDLIDKQLKVCFNKEEERLGSFYPHSTAS